MGCKTDCGWTNRKAKGAYKVSRQFIDALEKNCTILTASKIKERPDAREYDELMVFKMKLNG